MEGDGAARRPRKGSGGTTHEGDPTDARRRDGGPGADRLRGGRRRRRRRRRGADGRRARDGHRQPGEPGGQGGLTIQIDADEIRQGSCRESDADGRFILATFATDRGQREWIEGAKDYGGYYLVGRKWIVVGETRTVTAVLRTKLGGTLEEGTDHSAHSSAAAGRKG
jgi:hypothetical protein